MGILAQMTLGQWLLAALLIFVCVFLMIVILLQRGRGGGLAGAFGGAGGSAAFGAKTGDVFTWITVVVAAVFVLLAVVANFAFDQSLSPTREAPPAEEVLDGEVMPELPPAAPVGDGAGDASRPDGDADTAGVDEPSDDEPAAPGARPE
jgi:preprotein translocase subunit SecG